MHHSIAQLRLALIVFFVSSFSVACPDCLPSPEGLTFRCDRDADCASTQQCQDNLCVSLDAARLSADAGPQDSALLHQDSGHDAASAADASLEDAATEDAAIEDAATRDGSTGDSAAEDGGGASEDSGQVDAQLADSTWADATGTDAAAPDSAGEDGSEEDASSPDDAGPEDQGTTDATPANRPPSLLLNTTELWTYASSLHHAWTVTTTYTASDPDGDLVEPVVDRNSAPGCLLQNGQLIYSAPPGVSGTQYCHVYAQELGQNPLQSALQTLTLHVFAPRASCYRVLHDQDLKEKDLGQSSGLYQIDVDDQGPLEAFEVYCDQQTDEGGWTLALMARNSDSNFDLHYDSDFWASPSQGLLHLRGQQPPSPGIHRTAKSMAYNLLPFSELMIGMVSESQIDDDSELRYLQRRISGASLRAIFAERLPDWTPWQDTDLWSGETSPWQALLPASALQPYCHFEGFHVGDHPDYLTHARLGIIANNEVDCASNDSALGIGFNANTPNDLTVGSYNNDQQQSTPAYALLYLRDSELQSLTPRRSCMAHRLAGADRDGLYLIRPHPEAEWPPAFIADCDMQTQGGGWTLLMTNGPNDMWETWGTETFFGSWSLIGRPLPGDDFRSRAASQLQINDLRFASANNAQKWLMYRDAGQSQTLYDLLNSFSSPVCSMDQPNSVHLSAGSLTTDSLCNRSLYMSPQDQDGHDYCGDNNHAYGPAWSIDRNDGCPMDDPQFSSFRMLDKGNSRYAQHPFYEDSAIQTWGRETDFGALHWASSCQAHYDMGHHISGTYTIQQSPMGSVRPAYCLMDRERGFGWERIAHFDVGYMDDCPGDLVFTSGPRLCRGEFENDTGGVRSASFSVPGNYQHVRGFVRALQIGSPDAFSGTADLDAAYVDGLDLTYQTSGRRQHLWTYAVGLDRSGSNHPLSTCPGNTGGTAAPGFVGEHMFCDAAQLTWDGRLTYAYVENPLFDGIRSANPNNTQDPQWFERDLDTVSNSPIELRLMLDQDKTDEDIGLTALELYVR